MEEGFFIYRKSTHDHLHKKQKQKNNNDEEKNVPRELENDGNTQNNERKRKKTKHLNGYILFSPKAKKGIEMEVKMATLDFFSVVQKYGRIG